MKSRQVQRVVQQVAKRSLIVFTIGLGWFLVSPMIFLWGLTQFGFYRQWLTNYGTNAGDVYLFWTVIPEITLFVLGIFWAGGMLETIMEHIS